MVKKFTVRGLVQGIGYRPFVAKCADKLNIDGWVRNTGGIVTILAIGDEASIDNMHRFILNEVPTGGFISSVDVEPLDEYDINAYLGKGFAIVESDKDEASNLPLIPADIATCDTCKAELLDETNRRYRHPFISCTICGPRYSIIEKLPYDRDTISMADFDMCPDCAREYTAPLDIRRHAQTIACKHCGPELRFRLISNGEKPDVDFQNQTDEIESAVALLKNGGILALKDIGGYHLICDPFNEEAVAKLRRLKHREAKAFAVMFYDIAQAKEYARIDAKEEELLSSSARPIVLVKRIAKADGMAENVCLTSPDVGAMLPCNPVQILLTKECGPLIMTSGNASGDVLETDDERMSGWLLDRASSDECHDIIIGQLSHNRRILRPMDDSVMKVVKGRQQFLRRGRGHVPGPIKVDIDGEIFAAGGDLKATFCYVKNGLAYPSQYLGDLESVSCQQFYNNEKLKMLKIFGFNPKTVVVDKHPGYFSRLSNLKNIADDIKLMYVQHHKAHVAAVIAEHHLKGRVLGFAFDGTGYGDDGSIWGSEGFLCDGAGMDRISQLRTIKLLGGDAGAKNCDTILTGFVHACGLDDYFDKINRSLNIIDEGNALVVRAAIDNNINTINSSSMGRLFDAVSALLNICHANSYEGQAPIELENFASTAKKGYELHISKDGDVSGLLKGIFRGLDENVPKEEIALGFILAVSEYILKITLSNQDKLDENRQIVLSGGTFLNRILLEDIIEKLEAHSFNVFIANALPPGDGGICLGQAYVVQCNYSK